MRALIASILVFMALPVAAMACPAFSSSGPNTGGGTFDLQNLTTPQSFTTNAAGTVSVADCGAGWVGYVNVDETWNQAMPNVDIYFSNINGSYNVEFQVTQAACDTVMMVSRGQGQWLINDDTNGNRPLINATLSGTGGGTNVSVWVGTFGYSPQACNATLQVSASRQ